jgi:hypothetical protein
MGALTVTTSDRGVNGNKRWVRGSVAFSSSYATGGDTGLTAAALGLDAVEHMEINGKATYLLEYVNASGNVLAYYLDYDAAADGAAVQVPNTTDLSTPLATVYFFAFGT